MVNFFLWEDKMKANKIMKIVLLAIVIMFSMGAPRQVAYAIVQQDEPINYPPWGYHWESEGQVHSKDCFALGVAVDPDDPDRDVDVRILSDGEEVTTVKAEWYIEGGEPFCTGGTCLFFAHLWGLISPIEEHLITTQAYDVETGQWFDLEGTPKTLSCVNYDIYTMNMKTGQIARITTQDWTGEYNLSWSPDGKYLVYDVASLFSQDLYITAIDTLETALLPGGEGGNDAAWSPNGEWIVFDRMPWGEMNLYRISPQGGTPELIRGDAINADWSPNSQMLVYEKPSDGSLRTVLLRGGDENLIASQGITPAWSPNGRWIAYALDGDLWVVQVNGKGIALADPIQLTSGDAWDSNPSWMNNSRTIVFASNYGGDYDLWMIPLGGSEPVLLTGVSGIGDYDPDVSNNGLYVAWSGPQIP
jgi:Tol biopolymer transport system component